MRWEDDPVLELPAYTTADAARYLGLSYTTLHYWVAGKGSKRALIPIANDDPPELSFLNLLECHVLKALTTRYRLSMRKLRLGMETLSRLLDSPHPLLDQRFVTDGVDLMLQSSDVEDTAKLVNISRGGQIVMRDIVEMFLRRIRWNANGLIKYYPFVHQAAPSEPYIISITPMIASGRSVIDGTGISTAVIASRFAARETPSSLAKEYRLSEEQIHEAIRWEASYRTAPTRGYCPN